MGNVIMCIVLTTLLLCVPLCPPCWRCCCTKGQEEWRGDKKVQTKEAKKRKNSRPRATSKTSLCLKVPRDFSPASPMRPRDK